MVNWRWTTWLILIWTVFMAVMMVAVIYPGLPDSPAYDPPPGEDTAAYQAGAAFGVAMVYWALGMAVLGPLAFFTRKRVQCPVCGNKVSPKAARCNRCGFIPGMAYPQAYPPQAGWPQQPGQPMYPPQPGWPPQPGQQPPAGWAQPGQQPPAGWPPQPPQPPAAE